MRFGLKGIRLFEKPYVIFLMFNRYLFHVVRNHDAPKIRILILLGTVRDAERFIVGLDGSVYYTEDHYQSIRKIIK